MPKFDRFKINDLTEYLYNSYVHDANIEITTYDRKKQIFTIELFNPIFNSRISLTFEEVKAILSISGNEPGNRETIISLTAEKDYSYLEKCVNICGDFLSDSVYLLFQMFSGDELHIVSKNVIIRDAE